MPMRLQILIRTAGALLLLLASTWVIELGAFVALWRGRSLAPFAFFPHQAWDFLAKLRWAGADVLAWAPGLPNRFAGADAADQLSALGPLLPATLATALAVGLAGGLAAALLLRRRPTLRTAVLGWAAVGLAVHAAMALPALGLDEGLRISRLAFRARSLVVDGVVLSVLVSLAAAGLAAALARSLEASRAARALGLALVVAAAAVAPQPEVPGAPVVAATPDRTEDPLRNVVLVSLDSLRADHVGAYGYKRDTSPRFDRFAREGVLLRNMMSTSSWTLPTHLTMFTGRSQISHGVVVDTLELPPSIPTLGEIFHEAGYATAGFVSGPYVNGHYGYARGMDVYEDLSAGEKGAAARGAILSPAINAKALEWLDRDRGKQPFFLFLHYFDIHYDYVPPAPYDTMFDPDYTGTFDGREFIEKDAVHAGMDRRDLEHIEALYDGEIRYTDDHVGRILDRLREKGLMDNTVVLITADHGEEFFEHGNKGHHRTVYDEVLHIPAALHLPRGEGKGRVLDQQASLLDVFPTLLDASGLGAPVGVEGESIVRWIRHSTSEREAVYADFYDKRGFNLQVARRTARAKTIQHFNRITHPRRGSVEYYDLVDDPAEDDDRAAGHPVEVAATLDAMSAWLGTQWRFHLSVESAEGGRSFEIDEETRQKLESLGYAGD